MKKVTFILSIVLIVILWFTSHVSAREKLPTDILRQLDSYNVTWNTLSTTGSLESMPIGNGDITANVWVEKGGDLMLYIGKSDTWSEATRLLKVGRIKVKLSPSPFGEDLNYVQTLNLYKGEINIAAGAKGNRVNIRLWIDANQPVIRIETKSEKDISISCTTELMRPKQFILSPESHVASSFRGVTDGPVKLSESADALVGMPGRVEWYHRNETSLYGIILAKQNASGLIGKYPDPYINRTFGAAIKGTGMISRDDSTLVSQKAGKRFTLSVYSLTAQTESVSDWDRQLDEIIDSIEKQNIETSRVNHYAWWNRFWNRSWIFVTGDEDAKRVTRAYLLQRFMMACQSRGTYPVKFNGGSLTFDYDGENGDYRAWGPGYWHQNNRLLYLPLAASGDYDLEKPWFDMYKNMLPLQTDVTKLYYGHGGAFFPETLNFFGMFIQDDWGWDNQGKASQTRWIRYHFSGALEVLSEMIDHYEYTHDDAFAKEYIIPFATQAIRFFDQHWFRVNQTIRFVPANAIEQFWDCVNPVDYVAGLKYTITRLNDMPKGLIDTALLDEWNGCLRSLPPVPMSEDGKRVLPAEEYGIGRNFENPECYAIFPFKLYGLGLPNMDVALNTFNNRIFKQVACWSQDVIQAPLLGLTGLTKEYLMKNVNSLGPKVRFPAFWKPSNDYIPDFDNGGAFALGLQNMLLQNVNGKVLLLPAFPATWSVDFKLHAFDNTTVRVISKGTRVLKMDVSPVSRKTDVMYKDNLE